MELENLLINFTTDDTKLQKCMKHMEQEPRIQWLLKQKQKGKEKIELSSSIEDGKDYARAGLIIKVFKTLFKTEEKNSYIAETGNQILSGKNKIDNFDSNTYFMYQKGRKPDHFHNECLLSKKDFKSKKKSFKVTT